MRDLLALIASLALIAPSHAQDEAEPTPSGQAVPRFVSIKFDVANGRSGPSREHPIAWRYVRASLPLEVIAETPNWRRVRDPEGEVTWMHRRVLSGRRSVFTLEDTPLRARAELDAPEDAIAEAGVILSLERCRAGWCRIEAEGYRGWAQAETLWGVYTQERESAANQPADGTTALSPTLPHDTALR